MDWKTVPDDRVRHIWKDDAGKEHAVPPTYYAYSGTPIDSESGDDMEYVRTEVLETPRRASDYPKPPRPDPLKPIKRGG